MASSKLRVPPIFILVAAFVFQIVGIALLSTISVDTPPQTYGYEAILGIGIGLNFGSVIILTPNIVRGKDQSVAMGALSQLRALGGVIGLSIASNILSNHVKGDLSAVISPQQLDLLLQTSAAINSFPIEAQTVIRSVYADGYSLQMKAMTAFAAAQAIAVAIMWEKKLRRVA
ncbi:hypothetical protein MMC10_010638 [Thelotrema lepadinum]|nr:hypothetical protein [Thelotrema lepadinum]